MTIITKPLSEKKVDKLDQPLVAAECLPSQDVEVGEDGRGSLPPQDPRYLILRDRARRASSITTACLLLMAFLVMSCGFLGGLYLYKQFAHSQAEISKFQEEYYQEEQARTFESYKEMHRLRGWCRIPYERVYDQSEFEDVEDKPFARELQAKMLESFRLKSESQFMNEEFEIDADSNSYEKITVPDFDGGRSSRFIHDFNSNKTGIIDVEGHRCFVMPLNRSQVLPPRDLIDLVRKMWDGYYDVDTVAVRETMRVVLPPIKEPKTVGLYIQRECDGFPIYKLEKFVSGVFKRSASAEPVVFTVFSGKYVELAIANADELKSFEEHLKS